MRKMTYEELLMYHEIALDIATSKYTKEDIVNWINKFKI